jgi:hypothetical protein
MIKVFIFLLLPGFLFAQNITLVMTVDWEGKKISEKNISAIQKFRNNHPEIRMLHFLNPAYLIRPGADPEKLINQINSVLRDEDERGLHIHAWKFLVEYCGINYKASPSYANFDESCKNGKECGYTVSLEFAYSQKDLSKLVKCSKEILINYGFGEPKSFRAGGWQFGRKLAQALAENNFNWDSSRTDPEVLMPLWRRESNLVQMLLKLHPNASGIDQPFQILPGLIELPNNGNLADYTPPSRLLNLFKKNVENGGGFFVTGFHLDTADFTLPKLEKGLELIKKYSQENNVQINWAHFPILNYFPK